MFDNAVETETTQAATALEKTREQQRMLDQQLLILIILLSFAMMGLGLILTL